MKVHDEYWLQQNPNTSSIFAEARRMGMDIVWICSEQPRPGNVAYTGVVVVGGERMSKSFARSYLTHWIRARKEARVAYA